VAQTPWPRRHAEDHRLARCDHIEFLCQQCPLLYSVKDPYGQSYP
jgi:hypothetical protein